MKGKIDSVKTLISTLIFWQLMGVSSCLSSHEALAEGTSYRIACNLPLSGELSTYGSAVQEGTLLALEHIKSSEYSSAQLRFDWQDNKSQPREAVSILRQQLLDPPSLYISGVKPQYMAIAKELEDIGIPNFVWIFDISIKNLKNSNFRTFVNFKAEAPVFIEYAKKVQAKKIAVVYVQLPSTDQEYNEMVLPGLEKQGINDILVQAYQLDKNDFRDIALRVRSFSPDLIILSGFQANLISLVKSLRTLELIKNGNTIATYDMLDAAVLLAPSDVEGIRVVAPRFLTRPGENVVKTWTEDFRKKYKKSPIYTNAYAYDMTLIIADAAKKVSHSGNYSDWISALRSTDLMGITGRLRFDSDGDLEPQVEAGIFRNGKLFPDM